MTAPTAGSSAPGRPEDPGRALLSRAYLRFLVLAVLIGVAVALASFYFVSFQHTLQRMIWEDLPEALGHDRPPWWWPLPTLLLAGLILAPIVAWVPGRGGHVPAHGLGGPTLGPKALPGVVAAALAGLSLGVVLGPEAPLMAVGSGLALLFLHAVPHGGTQPDDKTIALVGMTGSTAAISTILGGPIVAALMVTEAAGLAGASLLMLVLPCLLAGAAGALVFTGFGDWTGLSIGGLGLPVVPPDALPDAGDFLWGIPLAALIAVVVESLRGLGRGTEAWTARHTVVRTVACASAAGVCIAAYALITDRNPADAALSGQATLANLAADPHSWSVGTLVALVACKGLAWGICLGSLRGGPIFPAVLIGAAAALAFSGLPGFGVTPALGLGISAAVAAVTGLPLTSAVLTVLLVHADAQDQTPLIVIASVVSFLTAQFVRGVRKSEPAA